MIGYGIPRTVSLSEPSKVGFPTIETIRYEWEEGYLWCSVEWEDWIENAEEFRTTDDFQFLRWNDFYLNNRARKIQRWFRSFEEIVYNPKNRRKSHII